MYWAYHRNRIAFSGVRTQECGAVQTQNDGCFGASPREIWAQVLIRKICTKSNLPLQLVEVARHARHGAFFETRPDRVSETETGW